MVLQERVRPRAMPALTSIRFFAAGIVLLFHFGAGFLHRIGMPSIVVQFFQNGYLGVSLFFVLSGFIISYAHQMDSFTPRTLANYGVSRIARIYPVYLLALSMALPLLPGSLSPFGVASVLTMVQSWAPPESPRGFTWIMQAWTLSVEAFFYILFPLLWSVVRKVSSKANIALMLGSAALIVGFGLSSVSPGVLTIPFIGDHTPVWLPIFRMPEFLYGMSLCRLLMDYPKLPAKLNNLISEVVVVVLMVLVLTLGTDVHTKAIFTVLVGVLILIISNASGFLTRLLSNRVLLLLGGASYALYIIQGPMRRICATIAPAPWDQFLNPIATIAVSVLIYIFYEQPIRKFVLLAYSNMNRGH